MLDCRATDGPPPAARDHRGVSGHGSRARARIPAQPGRARDRPERDMVSTDDRDAGHGHHLRADVGRAGQGAAVARARHAIPRDSRHALPCHGRGVAPLRRGLASGADGAAVQPRGCAAAGSARVAAGSRSYLQRHLHGAAAAADARGGDHCRCARGIRPRLSPGRTWPYRRRRLDPRRVREAAVVLPHHDRLPGDLHPGAVRRARARGLRTHVAQPRHRCARVVRRDAPAGSRDDQADVAADLEVLRHGVRHRIRHRRLV